MFLGNPLTAQVLVPPTLTETPVAPLTVYNCFEPVINCDMLHRGGDDVLKAITWDNGTLPSGIYNLILQNGTRKEAFNFLKK